MGGPKVIHLEIKFDRENQTYLPGDQVSGKIMVNFSKPKQLKGIRIVAMGESVVQWSVKSNQKNADGDEETLVLSGREEYFSSKYYLLRSGSGSPLTLPAGQLAYPFEFRLPMNIPYSFEHNLGFVRYTVSAFFEETSKTEHEIKATFNVLSTYDFNDKPEAALAIEEKVTKSFGCFCICMKGTLFATISVPASGFAPGQTIPVNVYCENESTVDISKIKISLLEKIKFHATTPQCDTKEVEVLVASEKCQKPFVNNSEEVTLNLRVPPLPPSGLDFCGLIDIKYILEVNICFSGFHCNIDRWFRVLIGTAPLYNFSNVAAMPPPTAPPILGPSNIQSPMQSHGILQPSGYIQHQQQFLGYMPQSSPYNPNVMNHQQNDFPPSYDASVQKR